MGGGGVKNANVSQDIYRIIAVEKAPRLWNVSKKSDTIRAKLTSRLHNLQELINLFFLQMNNHNDGSDD